VDNAVFARCMAGEVAYLTHWFSNCIDSKRIPLATVLRRGKAKL